jgi:hypothetical protein
MVSVKGSEGGLAMVSLPFFSSNPYCTASPSSATDSSSAEPSSTSGSPARCGRKRTAAVMSVWLS